MTWEVLQWEKKKLSFAQAVAYAYATWVILTSYTTHFRRRCSSPVKSLKHTSIFWPHFFFWKIIYLFIFDCLRLCCGVGFSLVAVSRGYALLECVGFSLQCLDSCGARALECASLVVVAAPLLWNVSSAVAEHGLSCCSPQAPGHRLNSYGVWA